MEGSVGVIVGPPCNGLALFALFIAFMLSFPGPIKHKLWYIPAGIIAIHVINVLRVLALVALVNWKEEWLEFNHDYTFTILVYLFVFFLWYLWIKKFSPLNSSTQ
jgi:exosortase/archaeosortase family protein